MDEYHPGWIESISHKLYSFVFALVPDELQSKQLVIDTISKALMQEPDQYVSAESKHSNIRKTLAPKLFKQCYELSKKRAYQLDGLLVDNEAVEPQWRVFYKTLSFEQRAIIFLDSKLGFSIEEIMEIVGAKRFELIELLHISRNKLGSNPSTLEG